MSTQHAQLLLGRGHECHGGARCMLQAVRSSQSILERQKNAIVNDFAPDKKVGIAATLAHGDAAVRALPKSSPAAGAHHGLGLMSCSGLPILLTKHQQGCGSSVDKAAYDVSAVPAPCRLLVLLLLTSFRLVSLSSLPSLMPRTSSRCQSSSVNAWSMLDRSRRQW